MKEAIGKRSEKPCAHTHTTLTKTTVEFLQEARGPDICAWVHVLDTLTKTDAGAGTTEMVKDSPRTVRMRTGAVWDSREDMPLLSFLLPVSAVFSKRKS